MKKRSLILLAGIAVFCLAVDQLSKYMIVRSLQYEGNSVRIIGSFLSFVLCYNQQGVFGLPLVRGVSYFVFPFLAVMLVVMYARSTQRVWHTITYGILLGGAFGNLIDRIFRPDGVVDFLQFRLAPLGIKWRIVNPWFVFNFADTCLIVGIILLMLLEVFGPKPAVSPAQAPVAPPEESKPV